MAAAATPGTNCAVISFCPECGRWSRVGHYLYDELYRYDNGKAPPSLFCNDCLKAKKYREALQTETNKCLMEFVKHQTGQIDFLKDKIVALEAEMEKLRKETVVV